MVSGTIEANGHEAEDEEEEPLILSDECRICHEEDIVKNLEVPCSCNGSLKYAHRNCIQHWCDEKGDIICEICHKPYRPDYTAPSHNTAIEISNDWGNGTSLDLNDSRVLATASADRRQRLLEAEYDYYDYYDSDSSHAAFARSAALILMALILLRHAVNLTSDSEDDDDPSAFFSLFLFRAAGFVLPFYIMVWAISILQQWRRRQEEAAEEAEVMDRDQGLGSGLPSAAPPDPTSHLPPPQPSPL